MNNSAEIRYHEALKNIPPPGTGSGCHVTLLSVANYGVMASVRREEIYEDIRLHIPPGKRHVTDKEIQETINKAIGDYTGNRFAPKPRPKPVIQDGKSALQKIINQAKITEEVDLWESSPIRLWDEPKDDPVLFLSILFEPTDLIWIGDNDQVGILGETIRPVSEWISYFQDGGKIPPQFIINPLNGKPAPKESGEGTTFRGNNNVIGYKYCMVEFDNLPLPSQIRFWAAIKLPVVCLISTGGKSIHGLVEVSKIAAVIKREEWNSEIKFRLYERILKPLGVDGSCSNPARLSRLPGHYREEKAAYQRLLWLSREGRYLC